MGRRFFLAKVEPIVNNNPPNGGTPGVNGQGDPQANVPINLPPGLTAQAVLQYSQTRNKSFDGWFKDQADHITEGWKLFENKNTASVKSNKIVALPIANGIIETINSRLIPALFNRPKVVDAIQEFIAPDDVNKLNVDAFVNQKVLFSVKAGDKGKAAVKGAIIESVMMWRHLWKRETFNVSEPQYQPDPAFIPDPLNPQTKPPMFYMGDQIKTQTKEFWTWEYKSPQSLAWEPTCTTRIQDSPWIREREKMSLNDFMKWRAEGRIGDVIDAIRKITPAGVSGGYKEDWETKRKSALGEKNLQFAYADEKEYKTEEWYACMTWESPDETGQNQTQYGEFHWFIVEDQVIILFEENDLPKKMKPFGSCPFYIKPRSVMGRSACDAVKGMQEQANTFAGKQNDLVDAVSNPLTFYDDKSGLEGRATFIKNQGLQPVLDAKGIYRPPADATPIKVNQEYIEFCINLCREISGANDQVQGIDGAQTATEFQGLVQDAGIRFADIVDTMSQMFLENLAEGCFLFFQKYGVDGQMIVRDSGPNGTPISLTRADLIGDYTFVAASSQSQAGKKQAITDDKEFVETMANIPPQMMAGKQYNLAKHIQEISLPLRDVKNGKDFFVDAPMAPPMPGQGMPVQTSQASQPMVPA